MFSFYPILYQNKAQIARQSMKQDYYLLYLQGKDMEKEGGGRVPLIDIEIF